jgi:phosphatidate cytidylyltransferase
LSNRPTIQPQTAATSGRSLSKSVAVGVVLGAVFLLSILIYKELFVALAAAAAAFGSWELSTALRVKNWYVPRVPAAVGSALIMPAAFIGGAAAQWLGAFAIVASLIIWRSVHLLWERRRSVDQTLKATLRDFAAAAFVVIYLPLTVSFTILLLRREQGDGQWWVLAVVVTAALIDTFGYLIGRKFGQHKMAPGVSPKKTWEGLLASITAGVASALSFNFFLLGGNWVTGLVMAAALLVAAVLGDLAESLIKRDLGVKDMSSWLPGHGGIMDRLDSILPSALVAYLISVALF